MAGERFVDGVVDHFVDEVVETGRRGGADVHTGAFPDGFESFEDLDIPGVVGGGVRLIF
jgi:hypothetical protein